MIKLSTIKSNPNNPRVIKDDKFSKLVNSIKEFPKMMELRPMVVNSDMVVLGGNMRLKALKEAGYKEVPDEWVKSAESLTEEEQRRFIIADNVGFGEHDWDMLANEWNAVELEAWGLDMPEIKNPKTEGEIFFSEELDYQSNYIVLKFTTDIDFTQIETLLDLKSSYSKRANGKPWSKGIGRVIDGTEAILKIKEL
jgi:hypothetical protein